MQTAIVILSYLIWVWTNFHESRHYLVVLITFSGIEEAKISGASYRLGPELEIP